MQSLEDYKVITITHHNLNVDELGHFVIKYDDKEHLQSRLQGLKDDLRIEELVYLSTCNRVSFIFTHNETISGEYLKAFFLNVNPDLQSETLDHIERYVSVFQGLKAVEHVMEVAASMDSLVVGEREIFRQLREAHERSLRFGHVGDALRLLDKYIVTAAKEVYEKTKIGEKPLSIVSLAVQELYASNISQDSRILMVGAGETNTLVAKFLKKKEFTDIAVFNRSLDNAAHLVDLLGARTYHLSELSAYDKGFDVLIVCTGATEAIITNDIYRNLLQRSEDQKVVIDLSVPANVASDVVSNYDMNYIDIEKLRSRAETNLEFRKGELAAARKLIKARLMEFQKVYQQRQLEIMLQEVPRGIKDIKQHAVSNVYAKKIEQLDDESRALVLEMMDYMEKKCISVPMKAAKALI